ncbi:unnamed protein product, partial [Mesorhabditis spiculigera]
MATLSESAEATTAFEFDVDDYNFRRNLMEHGISLPVDQIGKYEHADNDNAAHFSATTSFPSGLTQDTILHAVRMAEHGAPSFYHMPEMNRFQVPCAPRLAPAPSEYAFGELSETCCIDVAATPYTTMCTVKEMDEPTVTEGADFSLNGPATPTNSRYGSTVGKHLTPMAKRPFFAASGGDRYARTIDSQYCSELLQ